MKKIITIILITLSMILYYIANQSIGKGAYLASFFSVEQKKIIKKYIFPFKKQISVTSLDQTSLDQISKDLKFIKTNKKIKLQKDDDVILENTKLMSKFKIMDGFSAGSYKFYPGGYIDFHKDNLIVLSSRGLLAYTDDLEKKYLKQISNNLSQFIGIDQYKKNTAFSFRDLYIKNNKIYVSYTNEQKKDCWNTMVLEGSLENIKKKIYFKKLFNLSQCVHSKNNLDKVFSENHVGGRIAQIDKKHILLSIGDYGVRYLAQEKDSVFGKIIKINIKDSNFKIVSIGHRNPQGMYFDQQNDFILISEHGPTGGDEINMIKLDDVYEKKDLNFGWPIISYGEISYENEELEKKYLTKKKNKTGNFIRPLITFSPAVAPSQITKTHDNKFVLATMRDKSIILFNIENNEILNLEKIKIMERVRDLAFHDNKLYLFLENTNSIGTINFN